MNDWFRQNYKELDKAVQLRYLREHWEDMYWRECDLEGISDLIRLICKWGILVYKWDEYAPNTLIFFTGVSDYSKAEFFIITETKILVEEIQHNAYEWYE